MNRSCNMQRGLVLLLVSTFCPALYADFRPEQRVIVQSETNGASSVYAADLDADGDVDVLSSSYYGRIAWHANDGSGQFGTVQVIATEAAGATSVLAADLDGDGDLDVLSTSHNGKIAWYANGGSGHFSSQQVIGTVKADGCSINAADLDDDGDLDILLAFSVHHWGSDGHEWLDSQITWYENDGSGRFGSQQVITTAPDYPQSVCAADLDGDGDLDVLSGAGNKLSWYTNDGTGRFGGQQVITTEADYAQSVYAADLDGDGDLDVLSACLGDWRDDYKDAKIAWYENDGAGQFGPQQVVTTQGVGANCIDVWVYATDLDRDGDLDVLLASTLFKEGIGYDSEIAWYANDGTGQFGSQQVITTEAKGATSVYVADLDGDGDLDVLSVWSDCYNDDDRKIAWYENDGMGQFGSQDVITPKADGPNSVYAADMDGDGDLDVLSASSEDDKIAWYANDGTGQFGPQQVISAAAYGATCVYAADLDGDSDLDVLSVSCDYEADPNGKIAWYANDGTGQFGPQQVITTEPDHAQCMYAADLDGDGDLDVLSGGDVITWYANDGSGHFGPQQMISMDSTGANCVYAGDLDGDGDLDVLSTSAGRWVEASWSPAKIAWYANDGLGHFVPQEVIATMADSVQSVYAADLDGDGDLDVLSASCRFFWGYPLDDRIAWYANDGSGHFGGQQVISTDNNMANCVYAADLDSDGDMDVLSASSYHNPDSDRWISKVAWYVNDGSGQFGPEQVISTKVDGAACVYAADLDGDDDLDVLSASFGDDKIAWYENDGVGQFSCQRVVTTEVSSEESVYAADLDGDGDLDVLSASDYWQNSDSKIAWYANDGTGHFGPQQLITTAADGASCVYAADLDGDGDMDVLSASEYDDKIAWYANDGSGQFGPEQVITTRAWLPESIYAVDLDGDGDLDALWAGGRKIAWHANDGKGHFSSERVITVEARGPGSMYAADLDCDGDLDVLSAEINTVAWYANDGFGHFGPQEVITVMTTEGPGVTSVHAADLDGDGDLDVLSASSSGYPLYDDKIAWYANDGTGQFGPQQAITTEGDGPTSVYAADLDDDGDVDVLSTSFFSGYPPYDGKIAWYANDGTGQFGPRQVITTAADRASCVYAADLDGDGDLDVLSASYEDGKIAWYENE